MSPQIVTSTPVDLPDGRKVRVLAYEDGSIRFRVTGGGPYLIEEAYLQAKGPDQHAIVKLTPKAKSAAQPAYLGSA